MTRLVLIRHGQSTWNAEGRVQGQSDPPLSKLGRLQAEKLAQELAGQGIQEIWSSDLLRALQTAEALAGTTGLAVGREPRLREIGQGMWEGRLRDEIAREWPELISRWQEDPWSCSPPEGETLRQVRARTDSFFKELAARRFEGAVAVVTHKVPSALLTLRLLDADPSQIWRAAMATGSWREFAIPVGR